MLEGAGSTREHWTRNLQDMTGPVAILRMSQLVDFDARLTEPARIVYRFLIDWYHSGYGDALASVRHVVKVMRDRAPDGARHLSRSAVQRAVVLLIETGWLVRQYKGQGTAASRYVPVFNVLELASQGTFPAAMLDSVPVQWDATEGSDSVPEKWDSPIPEKWDAKLDSVPVARDEDIPTGRTYTRCEPVGISSPVADGLAANPPGGGFERLLAAYDRDGENVAEARRCFASIANADIDIERIVRAAASWKRTARGKRMTLARWLSERRWMSDSEVSLEPSSKWPSCVIRTIRPRLDEEGDFSGARITFKDRSGSTVTRVLDMREYRALQDAVEPDRPGVNSPSDDLHEFIGARFRLSADGQFEAVRAA